MNDRSSDNHKLEQVIRFRVTRISSLSSIDLRTDGQAAFVQARHRMIVTEKHKGISLGSTTICMRCSGANQQAARSVQLSVSALARVGL